jgi:hypothetical protein
VTRGRCAGKRIKGSRKPRIATLSCWKLVEKLRDIHIKDQMEIFSEVPQDCLP